MFALASAELQPYTRQILGAIAQTLNGVPNHLSVAGHTDAHAYAAGEHGYSNWDLSADRANAARRAMADAGLSDGRVIRVIGLADTVLFNAAAPLDPMNRRISIVVMNRKAETAVRQDTAVVKDADEARSAVEGSVPNLLEGLRPDIRPILMPSNMPPDTRPPGRGGKPAVAGRPSAVPDGAHNSLTPTNPGGL